MKVREAIAALGGIAAVAESLGAKRSTVSMWGVRESLPSEQVLPFWRLCLERDVAWEPPGAESIRHLLTGAAAPQAA